MKNFIAGEEHQGQRLDFFLKIMNAGNGLRGCRRLCEQGLARLNGKSASPAARVKTGDKIFIADGATEAPRSKLSPKLAADFGDIVFIYKPAAMHSVSLAGKTEPGLDFFLPDLIGRDGFFLLNRLDYQTSGLVAATSRAHLEHRWRTAENSGQCRKYYCAILQGRLLHEITMRNILRTNKRLKTRVQEEPDANPYRHTAIYPLLYLSAQDLTAFGLNLNTDSPEESFTLAGCLIQRGARHQIRAHAAKAGHPLAGDILYGSTINFDGYPDSDGESRYKSLSQKAGQAKFYLHHGKIKTPFGTAYCALREPYPLTDRVYEAWEAFLK